MKTNNTIIRTRSAFEDAMESMNRHAEWDAKNRTYTWKRQFMMDEFHFFDADDKIVWVEGGHDFDVTLEWLRKLDAEEREVEREELAEREGDYITEYWDDLCPYTAEDYGVDADEDWSSDYPPVPQWAKTSEHDKELIVTVIPEDDIIGPEDELVYRTDGTEESIQQILDELSENGFDIVDYGVYDVIYPEDDPDSGFWDDDVDDVDEEASAPELIEGERPPMTEDDFEFDELFGILPEDGFDVPFEVEEDRYGSDSVSFYGEDGHCFLHFLDLHRDGHYAMYVPSTFSFEEDGAAAGHVTMKVFGKSKLGAIFAMLKNAQMLNGPTFEGWVCVGSLCTRDVQDLYRAVKATLMSR